ncbi:hypothetical protein MPTK1_6g06260 [Marchantia polymorpha subsp. ruderalis]|uniref:Uncharacterized protein n=2 Tax=Marchantia polymorpha TaxID=3197 RepID=A0AAF6BP49_MARPO|nr:hypothetical protein MARPO_0097s0018 [Marchantia polymorpha]BBN13783.1 hypothetical protein Mp_6g06260 [Marchantia polymorpha subsp. ruderalis]|eukprot:PTQ32532.1 hypothetical protein MARPO_0097s0018 [Marchantia polymorpha]
MDSMTSCRAAAANVLAKLATGENVRNKVIVGKEGAIPALLKLIKQGSPKARETAVEALANLALNDWNKSKIIKEGGIDCLLKMMESCSQAEKDGATAALKVLQSPMGSVPKAQVLTDQKNWSIADNRQDLSRKKPLRRETDSSTCPQQKKYIRDASGEARYSREVSASQRQGIMSMLNTNLSDLSSPLATIQTVFTSELTSSLAPPLVGQPSIQADSVVGYSKGTSYMTQGRKRMKLSHPAYNIRGPQCMKVPRAADEAAGAGTQVLYQGDLLPGAHSEDRRFSFQPGWGRVGPSSYQAQGFQTAGCTHGETAEPRERVRQAAEGGDIQPISGGIAAIVNALSSQNPGAQEFSALALMLLASQGGHEVKTAIADAGALSPLVSMVSSSASPMIRESAAAAIAKLVSCHPVNRVALVRAGGIRALVEMAKWSARPMDGLSGGGSMGARTLAASIVAILSVSEVLDRPTMQLGLREALPALAHLLESDDIEEIKAGIGGLQAIASSLGVVVADPAVPERDVQNEVIQTRQSESIPIELVTSLLDLMRGSNYEAKEGAIESLGSFRKAKSSPGFVVDVRKPGDKDEIIALRKEGVEILLLLLARGPTTAGVREIIAGTFACVVTSERLHNHLLESSVIPHLMRLLQEGPTIATTILAASAMANFGAKKKCLETISVEDMPLLLRLLTNDFEGLDGSRTHGTGSQCPLSRGDSQLQNSNYCSNTNCSPSLLLREHAAAILVYTALSGEVKKQSLIAAGAAPIFVQLLQNCVAAAEMCMLSSIGHAGFLQSVTNTRQLNSLLPQATEEFAIMGLILLADKSVETMLKIVEAGGIPTLVKLLSMTGGRGRLGASWSEMAAAALLTLAGCETAREEIIRIGGITSLVQVLKGEGGASTFSLTGLAAMAQLLGVLAQNSSEAKLQMAKVGAVRCLVEILVGGGYRAWAGDGDGCLREGPGLVALAQEAAAAALATVVLHCPGNAEAAVEAGAIGPLVRLLGTSSARCPPGAPAEAQPVVETESGASSAETGVTIDGSAGKGLLSTRNSSSIVSEEDNEDVNAGGPLAAMAALGNMVSCYPQCGREIVDAGGLTRLLNLLQVKPVSHLKETHLNRDVASIHNTYSKVQEGAALVLGLLAEGDADVQEAIGCASVIPTLVDFSTVSKYNLSTASTYNVHTSAQLPPLAKAIFLRLNHQSTL